jgi:ketosteroid isomerase-like protein
MSDDAKLSAENVALATRLMEAFGRDMDGWYDNLHPGLVMELPFADTVGLPTRLDAEGAAGMFRTAADVFDVKFHDIVVTPLADPTKVVVEYKGYGEPGGRPYPQTYVCFQKYKDGKLIGYREYFDTAIVRDVLGDMIGAA